MKRHITSLISQGFGKFASKAFSPKFQNLINNTYVNIMGLDMTDFKSPEEYATLNALFTRELNEDRMFSLNVEDFISPCDAYISACGEIKEDLALQIKGMEYKTDALLGGHFTVQEKSVIHNGSFINFYLSPKDYHRYHVPTDMKIIKAVHIPGKFYPVNVASLNKRVNLFSENERVVILCENSDGKRFYMILVSALNVGVMKVSFEPRIQTNAKTITATLYEFENTVLKKGSDFGCFEMGSTIVILAQKNMLDLYTKQGDNVKYAQTIAKFH